MPDEKTPVDADERPTSPALGGLVDCPECGGQKRYVRFDDLGKSKVIRCGTCKALGEVSKDERDAYLAKRKSP